MNTPTITATARPTSRQSGPASINDHIDLILFTVRWHSPVLTATEEKAIRNVVRTALLETDRDARHRCAEAVSSPELIQNNYFMPASEVQTRAHAACVNARPPHVSRG